VAAWLSLLRQNAEEIRHHPADQSAAIARRASAIVSSRARSQIQRDEGAAIE
jgi:hypothetical protein